MLYDSIVAPVLGIHTTEEEADLRSVPLFDQENLPNVSKAQVEDNKDGSLETNRDLTDLFAGSNFLMRIAVIILSMTVIFIVIIFVLACRRLIMPKCCRCGLRFV